MHGKIVTLQSANDVFFHDRNGNGIYDSSEPMWQHVGPLTGTNFDYRAATDVALAASPLDGMTASRPYGSLGGYHPYYIDFNGDGTWSADELVKTDANQIEGAPAAVDYHDLN